jgi:hypothetical protein
VCRLVQQRSRCSQEPARVTWLKITGLSCGALDCPVSYKRPRSMLGDELVALGNSPRASRLKFTGLSGEPTTPAANGRQRDQRATRGPSQQSLQGDQRLNSRLRQKRKEIRHRTGTIHVRWCTRMSGAPPDRRQEFPSKWNSNSS